MGWCNDSAPGHEGYLIGLVREVNEHGSRVFRDIATPLLELAPVGERELRVTHVQVGCECGWRSPRMHAPFGTVWLPCIVCLPKHELEGVSLGGRVSFEDLCRQLWREHALGWVASGREVIAE